MEMAPLEGRILIIGSLNVDFIITVPHHPAAQDHVHGIRDQIQPGGHGANQAVACARLSRHDPAEIDQPNPDSEKVQITVSIVGAVGGLDSVGHKSEDGEADAMGKLVLNRLKENGVDIEGVKVFPDQQTGYAHINVDHSDRNNSRVTTMGKANAHLTPEMFIELPKPRPDLLLLQQEIPLRTVHHLINRAYKEKVPVILNAAPKNEVPDEIYRLVDHFILNEICADSMTGGAAPFHDRHEHIGDIQKHYLDACDHFHTLGARNVVITLNNLGAVGSTEDKESGRRKRYITDAAVGSRGVQDTTGGSDTFIGAYAVEVVRQAKLGQQFEMATTIDFAIKAAGITIGTMGSMDGIPWRNQVISAKFKKPDID